MGKLQKNLTDLAVVLANHLGKSEKLQAFCQERYQKKPLIAVGDATEEFSPTKADAPYIFFYALWKEEGIGKLECSYHCNLSVGKGLCWEQRGGGLCHSYTEGTGRL